MNGQVFLVGAGPGDPELLTLKALRLLEEADAVVYDRLVSEEILKLVPRGVARIDVGKQSGHHPVPQPEINETLIRLASSGRTVVRLKGGDPYLFGRGGEEVEALVNAGIAVEVVPGITSAQGCAASLGIPLTMRNFATSVRYITGHCRKGAALDFDWDGLADPDTTLVVYMGLANFRKIAAELMQHGRSAETPVAAVNNGTLDCERHLIATMGTISEAVGAARFQGPVLFIIGEVAGRAAFTGAESNADRHQAHPA